MIFHLMPTEDARKRLESLLTSNSSTEEFKLMADISSIPKTVQNELLEFAELRKNEKFLTTAKKDLQDDPEFPKWDSRYEELNRRLYFWAAFGEEL